MSEVATEPTTSAEVATAFADWWKSFATRAEHGRVPIRFHRRGEELTFTADVDVLGKSNVLIECKQRELRFVSRSDVLTISLLFLDVATRLSDRRLAFIVTPRSAESFLSLWSAKLDREMFQLRFWPSLLRMCQAAQKTSLNEAVVTRLVKAFAEVAKELDERVAGEAVSESSDVLSFVRLLEQPVILENLARSDVLAPARLRGVTARQQLLELAGGTLSSEEVAKTLGLTRQAVEKRRRARRLLALSVGKRGYRYPTFQFVDGQPLPSLESVLLALKDQDAWTQLAFFVNRRSDLDDQTPVALLEKNEIRAVLAAAESVGEQGAA